jgi:SAM-dependent methyltransferase
MLYAQRKNKGGLLELACGEGGDMNRWVNNDYKFVLGIDYVKHGIYNTDSGAYSRLINKRSEYFKNNYKKYPLRFPDIVYAAGDCGKSIINGDCSLSIDDEESANIIQLVLNKKAVNVPNHYKYIVGKGANGFDVCSCMFAIHYFFETEEKINEFLNNVSSLLRKGGEFVCTFMDGKSVVDSINANGGDKVEGRKKLNKYKEDKGVPLWAIIRRYDVETDFKKKVDVYIEATKKFIPEFIVNFDVLIRKCKEYNLELVESELFSQTFNKIKSKYLNTNVKKNNIYNIINDLDKEEELKQFSFLNRWCVFKRV